MQFVGGSHVLYEKEIKQVQEITMEEKEERERERERERAFSRMLKLILNNVRMIIFFIFSIVFIK